MYQIGDESGELEFCHNPFSMPNGGMDILLKAERGEIDPLDIYANQYDLVCNEMCIRDRSSSAPPTAASWPSTPSAPPPAPASRSPTLPG